MTWLALLFASKIAVTAVAVVGPLLLLRPATLSARMAVPALAVPLARLYGVALLALLVGYAGGLHASQNGQFPTAVVAMGIVSNAGATSALLLTGIARRHRVLTATFGAIAAGLAAAAVFPDAVLGRAW